MSRLEDDITGNMDFINAIQKIAIKEQKKNSTMLSGIRHSKKTYKKDLIRRQILIGFYQRRLSRVPQNSRHKLEYQLGKKTVDILKVNQRLAKKLIKSS